MLYTRYVIAIRREAEKHLGAAYSPSPLERELEGEATVKQAGSAMAKGLRVLGFPFSIIFKM